MKVALVDLSQLNILVLCKPFLTILSFQFSLVKTSYIAGVNSLILEEATIIPASPTTSGREVKSDVITGVPQAIASNGGMPKSA